MGKKKGGDNGMGDAISAQRQNAQQADNILQQSKQYIPTNYNYSGAFGSAQSNLDPATGQVSGSVNANDNLTKGFNQAIDNQTNFDDYSGKIASRYTDAYLNPIQRQIAEQLGNFYQQSNPSAGVNSKLLDAQGRYGQELGFQGAKQLVDLDQSARNQAQQQNQALYNMTYQPLAQVDSMGQGLYDDAQNAGRSLASIDASRASGFQQNGKNLANLYQQQAQMKAQQKQSSAAGLGSLIGTGVSALSTFAPMFSDIRLKKDIRRIGQLDNGLTVYKYKFKHQDTEHTGFIAQEVQKLMPEAVIQDDSGYLKVDYALAMG